MLQSSVLSVAQIGRVGKQYIATFDQVQVSIHIPFHSFNTPFWNTINLCIESGVLNCLGTDIDKDTLNIVLLTQLFKYT